MGLCRFTFSLNLFCCTTLDVTTKNICNYYGQTEAQLLITKTDQSQNCLLREAGEAHLSQNCLPREVGEAHLSPMLWPTLTQEKGKIMQEKINIDPYKKFKWNSKNIFQIMYSSTQEIQALHNKMISRSFLSQKREKRNEQLLASEHGNAVAVKYLTRSSQDLVRYIEA